MTENPTNNKKDIKKNYVDSALGTAIYILKSIDEGQSKKEIIQRANSLSMDTIPQDPELA